MDIQSLIYFSSAAKHLNYTKAANECYITRQALCQKLKALEEELNIQLFLNEHNHLSLTKEGRILYESSQPLLQEFAKLKDKISNINLQSRTIKLGVCSSMVPFQFRISEEELKSFEKDNHLLIQYEILTADQCYQKLENNELDCILTFQLKYTHPLYNYYSVYEGRVFCAHHQDLFTEKSELELEDLLPYPFYGIGNIHKMYKPLADDLEKNNLQMNFNVSSNAINTFYQLGCSDGIIFDLDLDTLYIPNIQLTPFKDYQWFVGLIMKKENEKNNLLPVLQDFIKLRYPSRKSS